MLITGAIKTVLWSYRGTDRTATYISKEIFLRTFSVTNNMLKLGLWIRIQEIKFVNYKQKKCKEIANNGNFIKVF